MSKLLGSLSVLSILFAGLFHHLLLYSYFSISLLVSLLSFVSLVFYLWIAELIDYINTYILNEEREYEKQQ